MIAGDKFCYWDAKSQQDTWILVGNLSIVIIISIWCVVYFKRKSIYLIHAHFRGIYAAIFLWAITQISGMLYGIIVFFSYKEQLISDLSLYSQIYLIMETIPALILQTILIFIPINILYNILNSLSLNKLMENKQDIKRYEMFQRYQKSRIIVFLIFWISLFIPFQYKIINIFSYVSILISIDCFFCIVILYKTIIYSRQASKILLKQSNQDQQTLKKQLQALMATCIFRVSVNIVCLIIFPMIYGGQQGKCIEQFSEHIKFSVINLIFGPMTTHFLPIICIIKMYRVDKIQNKLKKQILRDAQYSSNDIYTSIDESV